MKCDEARELLAGYADGELALPRQREVEKHLRNCSGCRAASSAMSALAGSLREAGPFRTPDRLRRAILQRLHEERASSAATGSRIPWWRIAVPSFVAGMAALWVFTLVAPGFRVQGVDAVVESHVRSLMANHLTDVASSDRHTVKPWFNGRLDFSPPVMDAEQAGFPLIGGRLEYIEGSVAAALVYQRRQHLINVIVRPAPGAGVDRTDSYQQQGFNIYTFRASGLAFWLVSDLNRTELADFARFYYRFVTTGTGPSGS